ncbi:hypothetical protein [Marinifilum caeruleilacunae]|uniref:Phage protein n=1 Tax=Marinifilum caeruleilacunae TaxID=2499076 RepID=A0ABX1WTN9_9BACT|nr:hypothetical protein [Marinifilum caeruleilacunae]NOU59447.1 hypothetical protein [Marinifilum caeruleilacunae]
MKNRIVSFKKLDNELMQLVNKTYPNGFEEAIQSYILGPNKSFYAFSISTEEYHFLVKVDMNYDLGLDMDEEECDTESDVDLD